MAVTRAEARQLLEDYVADDTNPEALRIIARRSLRDLQRHSESLGVDVVSGDELILCPRCDGDLVDGLFTDDPCRRCHGIGSLRLDGNGDPVDRADENDR